MLEPINVTVVYTGSDGQTHFREDTIQCKAIRASVPGNSLHVTPFTGSTDLGFLHIPADQTSEWHPASSEHYVLVLQGTAEIDVGDGARSDCGPRNSRLHDA